MNRIIALIILPLVFISCLQTIDHAGIESEIRTVIDQQKDGWNEGSIEGYMAGYFQSDSLRFASGGNVTYGWESTLKRYQKGYPDRSAMGFLTFSNIDVRVISSDAALVFGKWELEREKDHPWGLFTLIFRNTEDGWRIVHDHTSSAE